MKIIFTKFPMPRAKGSASKTLLTMKLTVLLLLVACLQVSAHLDAQNITYTKKNVSLEHVFRTIRKQTGYEFLYNTAMLKKAKKVDMEFSDTPLKKALDEILENQSLAYTMIGKTIVLRKKEEARFFLPKEIVFAEVQGTVVDASTGEPLEGVTIKVKGSTIGTVTGGDGEFNLNVPEDAVLVVSYLGYTSKEVPVNGRSEIRIELSATTTGLNQLVVVGYGTQKKEDLTGSVAQIGSEELTAGTPTNIAQAIQGKIAGAQVIQQGGGVPGGQPIIHIRGVNSINTSGTPLYVVDGLVGVQNPFRTLNPYDIESLSVLKGPSATAIYGARGANGVIVITTKKESPGKRR